MKSVLRYGAIILLGLPLWCLVFMALFVASAFCPSRKDVA